MYKFICLNCNTTVYFALKEPEQRKCFHCDGIMCYAEKVLTEIDDVETLNRFVAVEEIVADPNTFDGIIHTAARLLKTFCLNNSCDDCTMKGIIGCALENGNLAPYLWNTNSLRVVFTGGGRND